MQSASNIEELAACFQNKVSLIRQKLDLREIDSKTPLPSMTALASNIKEMEVLLTLMKAENNRRRAALDRIQKSKDVVKNMQTRINFASKNLPSHLPNRVMPPPPVPLPPVAPLSQSRIPRTSERKRFTIPETPAKDKPTNTPSIEQIRRTPHTLFMPAIDFITMEEFESVPKYMKGRFAYSQVNGAVDAFNKTLDIKYNVMSVPKSKRTDKMKATIREYKEQENKDTKGVHFVVEGDLKRHSGLHMGKATHALLTILRHCGRIREVRSKGLVRYAVVP